jgi:hypothetical protein
MTLGGLVKHLALVEADWLAVKLAGQEYGSPWDMVDFDADPDWEWRTGALDSPDVVGWKGPASDGGRRAEGRREGQALRTVGGPGVVVRVRRRALSVQAWPDRGDERRTHGTYRGDSSDLLLAATIVVIPALMVFLTLTLKAGVSRWTNLTLGILYTAVSAGNLIDETWAYYLLFGVLEIAITTLIVWYAWTWPRT